MSLLEESHASQKENQETEVMETSSLASGEGVKSNEGNAPSDDRQQQQQQGLNDNSSDVTEVNNPNGTVNDNDDDLGKEESPGDGNDDSTTTNEAHVDIVEDKSLDDQNEQNHGNLDANGNDDRTQVVETNEDEEKESLENGSNDQSSTSPSRNRDVNQIEEEKKGEPTQQLSLEEQIAVLTQERDAAQQVNKELLQKLSNNNNDQDLQEDSILAELQSSLQSQMTRRAEAEHQLKTMKQKLSSYETKLEEYSNMEDQMESLRTNMTQIIASKTQLEQEVSTLRTFREEYEHNTAILSNRLNEAKKKEANKASAADRLELDNQSLQDENLSLQSKLESITKQKEKLESNMEKLKKKCIERIQLTENALGEERNLNEERKKKMKLFVEQKAEELRSAKNTNDEIKSDLQKTSDVLNHVRTKLHHMTEMYESTSTKNRELIREMTRIKKNTEQLHNLGSNLELELHKSAQETEEHKQKRNTAKHELMTMLRKLEAEQAVSEKLKDSIKFTFTPKALSQQQLLNESLDDFETELLKLSRRLGKTLPPKIGGSLGSDASGGAGDGADIHDESTVEKDDDEGSTNDGTAKTKRNAKINSRSEWDTTRLLSNLEHETQLVSREIMTFNSAVERLHILLDDSGEKTCVSTLNELFSTLAAGGNNATTRSSGQSTNTVNLDAKFSNHGSVMHYEDENDSFTGTPVKRRTERYGLVPPSN